MWYEQEWKEASSLHSSAYANEAYDSKRLLFTLLLKPVVLLSNHLNCWSCLCPSCYSSCCTSHSCCCRSLYPSLLCSCSSLLVFFLRLFLYFLKQFFYFLKPFV